MENVIKDVISVIRDIINYWPAIVSSSGIVALGFRQINKRQDQRDRAQEDSMKLMRIEIKRIELSQAINHDYGLQIVSSIFDEYVALGGN
ncbi:hypothetical protein, partial [Lactococcus hircilactis]